MRKEYVSFLLWGQILREPLDRPVDIRMEFWRLGIGQEGCLPRVNTDKSTL